MKYLIEVKDLCKNFGEKEILKNINLKIKKQEIVTIIGFSGSGKSTLLRCFNLLEEPNSGQILIDNKNILDKDVKLSDLRTKVGMVFQSFNLFEGKTVLENCCLAPIKVLKLSKKEAQKNALERLKELDLEVLANQRVETLSGGQKQLVAIARVLCMKPEVILLDEPTSALDPESTLQVLQTLQKLSEKKINLIIVTHEMKFAQRVSDTIYFMEQGKILEKGTPKEIFATDNFPKSKSFFEYF